MARVCSWSKIHSRLTPDVNRTRRPWSRRAFDFEDVMVGIEEVDLGKLAGPWRRAMVCVGSSS
jgi:hypothetical protein